MAKDTEEKSSRLFSTVNIAREIRAYQMRYFADQVYFPQLRLPQLLHLYITSVENTTGTQMRYVTVLSPPCVISANAIAIRTQHQSRKERATGPVRVLPLAHRLRSPITQLPRYTVNCFLHRLHTRLQVAPLLYHQVLAPSSLIDPENRLWGRMRVEENMSGRGREIIVGD